MQVADLSLKLVDFFVRSRSWLLQQTKLAGTVFVKLKALILCLSGTASW